MSKKDAAYPIGKTRLECIGVIICAVIMSIATFQVQSSLPLRLDLHTRSCQSQADLRSVCTAGGRTTPAGLLSKGHYAGTGGGIFPSPSGLGTVVSLRLQVITESSQALYAGLRHGELPPDARPGLPLPSEIAVMPCCLRAPRLLAMACKSAAACAALQVFSQRWMLDSG